MKASELELAVISDWPGDWPKELFKDYTDKLLY